MISNGGIHPSLSPTYTQNVSIAAGLERYDDFLRCTVSLPRKSIRMRLPEIYMNAKLLVCHVYCCAPREDSGFVVFAC